ncbi:hypothetical protein NQD34_005044 [Periophthalmus magnuspinnatus]|nr:hypothetical protein NQD34_005044 [Periophthalmus magnuspinnatus]
MACVSKPMRINCFPFQHFEQRAVLMTQTVQEIGQYLTGHLQPSRYICDFAFTIWHSALFFSSLSLFLSSPFFFFFFFFSRWAPSSSCSREQPTWFCYPKQKTWREWTRAETSLKSEKDVPSVRSRLQLVSRTIIQLDISVELGKNSVFLLSL